MFVSKIYAFQFILTRIHFVSNEFVLKNIYPQIQVVRKKLSKPLHISQVRLYEWKAICSILINII